MNIDQDRIFAAAAKIHQVLLDLSHDDCDPGDEFNRVEVLTCLQLATMRTTRGDCFEARIHPVSRELWDSFNEFFWSRQPVPTLREQAAN